jgi:Uncharacterized protein conserved in bacteria, putative lipoprotein
MRNLSTTVAAVVVALMASDSNAAAANSRPSFNCRKAGNWAEKTICGDQALADLDRRMADVYPRVRNSVPDAQRPALEESQQAWITERNACEKVAAPLDCLRRSYEERLAALVDVESRVEIERRLPPVIRSTFVCDDGRDLEVAFYTEEPTRVVIVAGRRTIDLPQTTSASGARYSDGVTTFWNKGDQALFHWANGSARCRARH